MLNVFLLEPASSGKRRTFSDRFIKTKGAGQLDLKDVKKRLREIRFHVGWEELRTRFKPFF